MCRDLCVDLAPYKLFSLCVYLTSFLTFFASYFLLSLCFLTYLLPYLCISWLIYLSTPSRTDPFHFQAGGHKRRPNLALFFCVNFYVVVYSVTDVYLLLLCLFSFRVLSQEIGCEERLRSEIFCVRWEVKPYLNQSISLWCAVYVVCRIRWWLDEWCYTDSTDVQP